ncbi:MAG: hypothetical protein M0027_15020 [Candidatus Dormibacteraeota bacterium]|jgi:hypothetical protein|nr:hypothetical protein [Candidatus Dormibacteraeota bacterium]
MKDPLDDMLAQTQSRTPGRSPKVPPPQARRVAGGAAGSEVKNESLPGSVAERRFAPRHLRVQLWEDQETWLLELTGDALHSGIRIGDSEVVRLAMEHLKRIGGWETLREELIAEKAARLQRHGRRL